MARLVVPSISMSLLLAVFVVLSSVPSSAPATFNPLGDLLANGQATAASFSSSSTPLPGDTNYSGGDASPPPSKEENGNNNGDNDNRQKEKEKEKEQQKQKEKEQQKQKEKEKEQQKQKEQEKQKERQQEKEKAIAAEREVQKEYLKYAKEKGLVSPTNGTGWYKGIAREFLNAHNEARARYGVKPMKWDKKLARQARRWSNAMRKDCQMLHSGRDGESVFRSHDDWNATAKEAVIWWSKEESMYDKNTEKCTGGHLFKDCGHFALMVGKRSRKVGCARAECFKGGVFITCNYDAADDLQKEKDKEKEKDKDKAGQN